MEPHLAESSLAAVAAPKPRFLDELRAAMRVRQYSLRTEHAYVDWARRFIVFHGKRHPRDMGAAEVEAFLSHLATERNISAATQQQARSALLFLYKALLQVDLPWLDDVVSARPLRRLPVVLTKRRWPRCCITCLRACRHCSRSCSTAPACACSKGCGCR